MSKISKTAAAAMKAGQGVQTKVDHFGTNEKKIKELRNQRRDGLAVNRFDFIDALIEEFDKTSRTYVELETSHAKLFSTVERQSESTSALLNRAENAEALARSLQAELDGLRRTLSEATNTGDGSYRP